MSFRSHFDMISLNEPVTRKARFWQSYVRALKGTEDMRADDRVRFNRPRALSEFPEFGRSSSLWDEAGDPNTRISAPGYRYLPISRETYGYSPRAIYGPIDRPRYVPRTLSQPPEDPWGGLREGTPYSLPREATPFIKDTTPFIPETSVAPNYYPRSYYTRPYSRSLSPDLEAEPLSYYYPGGVPMHPVRGGLSRRPFADLINPSPYLPMSAITRDPWWHDAYGLRPYSYIPRYPSALRTSFLSPVKNRYLWTRHPLRYL